MKKINQPDALEWLLAPITVSEFIKSFWENEHLHLVRNNPDFYSAILTLGELDEYLSRNDIRYPSLRMIKSGKGVALSEFSRALKFGNYASEGLVDMDRVYEHYKQGASLVLQLMKSSLNGLSVFTNQLQQRLRFNIEATVYVTPSSEQGFTTHYDTHSVIVLQISGKKRWRLYDYPRRLPLLNETFDTIKYTPPAPSKDITLNPGDLLYVPRGLAHDATSTDGEKSVHITLGLFPVMWRDLLEAQFDELKKNAIFRRAPVSYFFPNSDKHFPKEWDKIASQAFDGGDIFQLKKGALAKHLPRQNRMTAGRLKDCELVLSLHRNSKIRFRSDVVYSIEFNQQQLIISFYDKRVSFPLAVQPAIERILSGKELFVHEIQENLDEKGQITLVKKLVVEGLLEMI